MLDWLKNLNQGYFIGIWIIILTVFFLIEGKREYDEKRKLDQDV